MDAFRAVKPLKPFDEMDRALVFVQFTGGNGCSAAAAVPPTTVSVRNIMAKEGWGDRNFAKMHGRLCLLKRCAAQSQEIARQDSRPYDRYHSMHPRTSAPLFSV